MKLTLIFKVNPRNKILFDEIAEKNLLDKPQEDKGSGSQVPGSATRTIIYLITKNLRWIATEEQLNLVNGTRHLELGILSNKELSTYTKL